ncbi:hypothetical protein JXL21_08460 [Candidatus Bathyarchaeota archaeon]|nr:hypothetical protein [Candidatus Bathyarchaeota archaeon]
MSRRRRRGYPLAVMIGIKGRVAVVWDIYSESAKKRQSIHGEDDYGFHESLVDAIRPGVKQGIKSVVVASADEGDYRTFMRHVEKHQSWLLKGWELNTATFKHVALDAMDEGQVKTVVRTRGFMDGLSEASHGDEQHVMDVLEKRLSTSEGIETLLYSLDEVEEALYGDGSLDYILVTEDFVSRHRRRTQKILQIAANKGVKTKVIGSKSKHCGRIAQFGGLICIVNDSALQ